MFRHYIFLEWGLDDSAHRCGHGPGSGGAASARVGDTGAAGHDPDEWSSTESQAIDLSAADKRH